MVIDSRISRLPSWKSASAARRCSSGIPLLHACSCAGSPGLAPGAGGGSRSSIGSIAAAGPAQSAAAARRAGQRRRRAVMGLLSPRKRLRQRAAELLLEAPHAVLLLLEPEGELPRGLVGALLLTPRERRGGLG